MLSIIALTIYVVGVVFFSWVVETQPSAVTYKNSRAPFVIRQLVALTWFLWVALAIIINIPFFRKGGHTK